MTRFGKKPAGASMTCAYEDERAANIARNRERMMALGILDASSKIANAGHASRLAERKKRARAPSKTGVNARAITLSRASIRPRVVTRRSGRLSPGSNGTVIDTVDSDFDERTPSYNTEMYTAAHRDALGTSKTQWQLFLDGYDTDGARIYDKSRGKTCHQCRQKTVCKHTNCSSCNSLKGQFCGDCLWMRYGENVVEANVNSDWKCPSCRDLCNCSFCRSRKGYPPTGSMYRRAIAEGFQSVAHYLVLGGDDVSSGEDDGKSGPRVAQPSTPSL